MEEVEASVEGMRWEEKEEGGEEQVVAHDRRRQEGD